MIKKFYNEEKGFYNSVFFFAVFYMKLETAKRWLILFYEKIQENVAVLAELDSTMGGDGDHGENMLRGMTAVVNTVEPKEFASTSDLFKETGMLLLTKVGGVSGT
ncbi:Phospho-enol-pyruvate-dihydroxy-acetone-phosphotransferase, ADP-binding subunit DhaL [Streptococcus infantarius subsp. infantarius]|nr:Phospho-enol-pyruvate-dihydroxy-acetone-phosphotransferase, ADP-binding subunit DhaL [Streptococcus infantarius subsp. infantarius]MCO4528145.1 Phospho-enol-pyruvate-dihydroxy-acetone-phosphotransferase, ADP-binding subunit DhaL [Streptococcus infantarius subsp. infantarius]